MKKNRHGTDLKREKHTAKMFTTGNPGLNQWVISLSREQELKRDIDITKVEEEKIGEWDRKGGWGGCERMG